MLESDGGGGGCGSGIAPTSPTERMDQQPRRG